MALERGWTDGLVVAPPTRERVDRMIAYLGGRPDEMVGVLGPKDGVATIEQIAINCVMAGCLQEYAPVVLAAIEAMLEPEFNLHGVQATTNPCASLVSSMGRSSRIARLPCEGRCIWRRFARPVPASAAP